MILDTSSVCGAIDNNLAELIHTVITLLKFGIPILLIIMILNGKTQNSSGSTNNNAINRNNKIEACCNQAGGTLNTNGNNKSCMLEQNKQAEYDKCMNN